MAQSSAKTQVTLYFIASCSAQPGIQEYERPAPDSGHCQRRSQECDASPQVVLSLMAYRDDGDGFCIVNLEQRHVSRFFKWNNELAMARHVRCYFPTGKRRERQQRQAAANSTEHFLGGRHIHIKQKIVKTKQACFSSLGEANAIV